MCIRDSPNTDEFSAERDQPWPGGRMNHYNFDLNRDWFALTQPETQGQTKAFLEYYPQVVVDAHEMGRDGNFFFPPEADPINPVSYTHLDVYKRQICTCRSSRNRSPRNFIPASQGKRRVKTHRHCRRFCG